MWMWQALQNVRSMTNGPTPTANYKGWVDKEEEGEQDAEEQPKRRRRNRRLT